ncbi:MAG: L-2-amino-thiazoline-4-carboxylic acid hydrolase [Anaerolineae bacterium]
MVARKSETASYYLSRRKDILDLYYTHSRAWRPFLARRYGDAFAQDIIQEAREILEDLIPDLPYIGGDDNPMTRHIIRCSTSLALYKAMKARGKSAEETGEIIYDAVVESVRQMPRTPPPSEEDLARKKKRARVSQERRYPGDWVREFVEGDGENFEYGYDFYECGAQKLYHAHGADEFLPFFCYLDFVTYRTPGWSFSRTMTLAEGHDKCDFRFKKGGETKKEWPPPFLHD